MIYKAFAAVLTIGLVSSMVVVQDNRYVSKPKNRYIFKAQVVVPDGPPTGTRKIVIRDRSNLPECPNQGGPVFVEPCPEGYELVIFDQPVYDRDGIFVICLERVPYCIPVGLEPEG